ncbi:hypothetical protein CEXT_588981 [Caerostris extrusa]|uniref:Uncharacterized protein n=1 Tax=Caerostris extrusa TaxID=172846 RepID=A0AAV4TQG0_CAEEX|nr:hypothetical protein CEXT_588981 [Caerostris extrusa]
MRANSRVFAPWTIASAAMDATDFDAEKDYLLFFASANTDESAKSAVDLHCCSLTLQPATECIAELSEASAARK